MSFLANSLAMKRQTPEEFAGMERLLADLLLLSDPEEEDALMRLHARLQEIYAAQSDLQTSRDLLMALQSQTAR